MASDGEFAEEASEGSELPDVTVGQQHFVYLKATNKKWLIQDCYVKEMESGDGKWLQLSSACYGLCNLLCHGQIGRQPTLKGSPGLVQLLEKRTAALDALAQPTKLFEDAAKPAKKRKVQCIDPIMLDLEEYGTLVVQPASKKTQDLHIAFTADNVRAFCQWMLAKGSEGASGSARRPYKASGKYKASAKKAA